MKAVVAERGQVTIPKALRDKLGIRPGTTLEFAASNGTLVARKAETGRMEEIRYCISCNQGCIGRVQAGLSIECVLNPVAGLERQYGAGKIAPASRKKRVVVVGGGPAGMKAAETAASTSATSASATSPTTSSFAGLILAKVWPPAPSTHLPPI